MSKKLTFREFHLFKKLKSKKIPFCLQDLKLRCNFCTRQKTNDARKDGRVVDYTGLENRRAERHRGFESLSFRNIGVTW